MRGLDLRSAAWKALAEARGKFVVDAVEAAIGKDGDDIAGRELRRDGGDDGVGVGEQLGRRACRVEGADDFFRVQPLVLGNALLLEDAGEDDVIGEREACDEIVRQDFAAERVGARLEHGPEAPPRIDGAQCAEGFADGGGVVSEVFDDGDAVDYCADFKAALDALEGGESFGRLQSVGMPAAAARAAAAVAFSALCSPARSILKFGPGERRRGRLPSACGRFRGGDC